LHKAIRAHGGTIVKMTGDGAMPHSRPRMLRLPRRSMRNSAWGVRAGERRARCVCGWACIQVLRNSGPATISGRR
jgi:hypothetical protein